MAEEEEEEEPDEEEYEEEEEEEEEGEREEVEEEHEGGWAEGGYLMSTASPPKAIIYFLRAMLLGSPWVVYDDATRSLRVLYVVEGVNVQFTQAWSIMEEWCSDKIDSAGTKRAREAEVGGGANYSSAAWISGGRRQSAQLRPIGQAA